jgi:hypothetical protein
MQEGKTGGKGMTTGDGIIPWEPGRWDWAYCVISVVRHERDADATPVSSFPDKYLFLQHTEFIEADIRRENNRDRDTDCS